MAVPFKNRSTHPEIQLTGGTAADAGVLSWNVPEGTLDLIQEGTTLQLGQEQHYHVKNSSGVTIADGTAVMATGTDGISGHITIAPMVADGTVSPKFYLGVTTQSIPNGGFGKVTNFGKVNDINTSAFTQGAVLWVDPTVPGGLTMTTPIAPQLKLATAFVVASHAVNGKIFVRANAGIDLHENHRVQIESPDAFGNPQVDGQLLTWDQTGMHWHNSGTVIIDTATDSVKFFAYGSGTKTGTAAYNLSVDASGNIIETPHIDGSGTATRLALWSDANTLTSGSVVDDGTGYVDIDSAGNDALLSLYGHSNGPTIKLFHWDTSNSYSRLTSDTSLFEIAFKHNTTDINVVGAETFPLAYSAGAGNASNAYTFLQVNGSDKLKLTATEAQILNANLSVSSGLKDSLGSLGTAGQVLQSTGTATTWADAATGGSSGALTIQKNSYTGDGTTVAFVLQSDITSETLTQVYIDGVYQSKDNYSTTGSTLTFSTAPPSGAAVEVMHMLFLDALVDRITFTGDGTTVAYALPREIANENDVQIYIDGVYQSKDNYTTLNKTVTLSTAAPNGTEVEIVHLVSQATTPSTISTNALVGDGTTVTFTLSQSIDSQDKTFVFLQGVYQEKETYSISGNQITFTTAPQNGYSVEVVTFSSISLYPSEGVQVITANTTASTNTLYVLNSTLTLTLPLTPSTGDTVSVSNLSGGTTSVVARNGSNIMGLAEDLTLDVLNIGLKLTYTDATNGWVVQ